MNPFRALVARELRLAIRARAQLTLVPVFFAIAVALIPLGVGALPETLARIAPGTVWVATLLASMLSLERMFGPDHEDGSLEQLLTSDVPVFVLVLAKGLAHWLVTGLPLSLLAPAGALALGMDSRGVWVLILAMLIGTPALALIGTIGAALTVPLRHGGVLAALLVLPQAIPVLVFGATACEQVIRGQSAGPHLSLLGGITLALVVLAPLAASRALHALRE